MLRPESDEDFARPSGTLKLQKLNHADFLYGSGLRRTPNGGPPNGAALPSYTVVNATVSHTWRGTPIGAVEARLALLNLFDRSYELRDGSGVGVGAPQWALRRSVYLGLSTSF